MISNRTNIGFFPRIRNIITDNFYIIFVLLSFLSFRSLIPDSIRTAMWIVLFILNIPLVFRRKGVIDNLIILYILLGLFSFLGWVQRQYPISFFFTILFQSYVPIIFYYIGCESSGQYPVFYRRCMYAFLVVNLVGFILLYTMPGWYVEKSLEILNQLSYYTEDTLKYARFASFLDSYHTANFSVFLLCISLGGYYFMNDKPRARIFFMFVLMVSMIGILLSQQRVAMFIGIALFPCGMFLMRKKGSSSKKASLRLAFLLVICLVGIVLLAFRFADYFSIEDILVRFSGSSRETMVSDRSWTWVNALKSQENFIWGHGLGGGGHLASAAGIKPVVTDGSYFVILLETGLLSLICFLAILGLTVIRGLKHSTENFIDLTIVVFSCFSLIGANIIYYPYIIGIMWYAIGRINRKRTIIQCNNEKEY